MSLRDRGPDPLLSTHIFMAYQGPSSYSELGGKRNRSGGGGTAAGGERVRTHLLFTSHPEHHAIKKKRRPHNKLQITTHKKDEMVQAGSGEIDPSTWTGNQRVLHFGPMAQRDPYFYYYPKGWDVLYPAHFGFFPYRTEKFRGSASAVCACSFGVFLILGGTFMMFLGYFALYDSPFWKWPPEERLRPPPIQVMGPVMTVLGCILLFASLICTLSSSNFFKLYLHHTQKHEHPSRITTITKYYQDTPSTMERHPYQRLPPPAYPVLENKYAHSNMVRPKDELKLYPPVMPGMSTLSLNGRSTSNVFIASPYNTLRATSLSKYHSAVINAGKLMDNTQRDSESTAMMGSEKEKRSKSTGLLHSQTSRGKRHRSHL